MTKKAWKNCHPVQVKVTQKQMRINVTFKEPYATYMRNAAIELSNGCVCELVHTLFMGTFKELSKTIDEEANVSNTNGDQDSD